MRLHSFLMATLAVMVIAAGAPSRVHAQAATFSRFNDAVAGRCYEPATTDATEPNLLRIGMAACTASAPNGTTAVMDTFAFEVTAPEGFFISRLTFTQTGTTSGSRGGRGFYGVNWTIDKTPFSAIGTVDISLQRKTSVPVSITTYLAAFGIQVVSGSASASNPLVRVEVAPLE